ncbi:Mu transposase C-terminal domain-containing protein [Cereibacter sp. SYSU M97828]|nr:Mu transposase C-terminal domain-containing protein [Cereibacter flavus]
MPVDAMDRRAIFGVELERAVTGRGVRVFGADYACDELREAYKHRHVHKVRLRFDQLDMGWIAVEVAGKWYPAYDLSGALSGVSFYQWCAYAKTVMGHHREGAALTAAVYHDGLRRLELLSTEAAKAAQLGRMTLSADEVDKAEKALGLGLHLLPAVPTTESGAESDWFSGGFEAGVETIPDAEDVPPIQPPQDDEATFPPESSSSDSKDLPPTADDNGDDPFVGGDWRFEDDE